MCVSSVTFLQNLNLSLHCLADFINKSTKLLNLPNQTITTTRTGKKKAVPEHFNGPGHSISDMLFVPFEKIMNRDETLLKSREEYWIRRKLSYEKGINRQK